MNILISGGKHSGKTTIAEKLVEKLKKNNIPVGGVLCIGDDITDIITSETQRFLYHEEVPDSQHIGHHYIKNSVIKFAEEAIQKALNTGAYAVIDEYGKLELRDGGFHNITNKNLSSDKCIIVIRNINIPDFIERFKTYEFKVFELPHKNKNNLYEEVFRYIKLGEA